MKFQFRDLDDITRTHMYNEIRSAHNSKNLYYSTRFNNEGNAYWHQWLLEAAKSYDEHWLAYQLESNSAMKEFENKSKPTGGYTTAHIPHTAAQTLADGQFNRFYIAAICRKAVSSGHTHVQVYRACARQNPRQESASLEGKMLQASDLLQQVRNREMSLKCDLLKPNSGLSVFMTTQT